MSVYYTDEDDLNIDVAPLSKYEKAWIERFDKIMSKMPKRLRVLEAGDSVSIYDQIAANGTDLNDGLCQEKGLSLAECHGALFKIDSVSA